MKNFIARGDALTITAAAAFSSGDVVELADVVGIAAGDIADGEEGVINITGTYEVPKVGSQAWAIGDAVYWNGAAATKTATSNTFMGFAANVVAGGAGDTLGHVRLTPSLPNGA